MMSLLLLAMVLVGLSGCSQDLHDHPTLTTGEKLFIHHCAECHGMQGAGILIEGIPAIILTKKSPGEIIQYLTTESGHEREFPAFSSRQADEVKIIINHVLTLKNAFEKNGRQIKQFLIEP